MKRISLWIACLLSLAVSAMAMARLRQESVDLLGSIPSSVHAALLIEGGGSLRRAPAGMAYERWLTSAGLLSETSEAWKQLAAMMDVTPDQAFDALLGKSALLVVEFVPSGEPGGVDMRWAVMSRVDAELERRLYERLKPAPRGISGGRPILSLENGRFELATTDASTELADPHHERRAMAILAPASSSALFDRLVSGRGKAGERLADVPGFELVRSLGDNPVIGLLRGPLPGKYATPESLKEPASILAIGMHPAGDTRWEMRLAGNPALMTASRPAGGMAALTVPRAALRQVSADAFLVFAGATDGIGFSRFPGPMGEQIAKLTGPSEQLDAMLGPRMLAWLHGAEGSSSFAMSMGIEMSDVARGSEAGDEVLSRLLRNHACPTGPGGTGLADQLAFDGLEPQAQRTVEFRPADQPTPHEGEEHAYMAWSYEGAGAGEAKNGWWIASVARGGTTLAVSSELDRLRAAVRAPAEAERDVFSVLRLRPAAFARLAGAAADAVPMLRSFAQVESLGWEVFLDDAGSARGTAWLEFAKAEGTDAANDTPERKNEAESAGTPSPGAATPK